MKKLNSLLLLTFLLTLYGCNQQETPKDEKIPVITSILPYADFISAIGGKQLDVQVIIPPGVSPAMFDPSPELFKKVQKSDIYFTVGEYFVFEKNWLKKIQDMNPDLHIVDCSQNITIKDHNPHVWLSPDHATRIVKTISKSLVEHYPQHADIFVQNTEKYLLSLDSIKSIHQDLFANIDQKYFLTFHPAWSYLAEDFGLKEVSIEKHGKEPNPQDLKDIILFAKKHNISTIFVQPQFDTTAAASIADEINASIVTIDPLPVNYLKNLDDVISKIAKAVEND